MLKNCANTSVAYSEQDRGPHRADLSPQGSPHLGGLSTGIPKVCGAVVPEPRP